MAVPESFQVVRTGGSQALTVTTLTQGGYNLGGGMLLTSGTPQMLSVNVRGALDALNTRFLEPGDYEGVLAVVVQYN
jgi:2-keto-4-pentenoate hydratase/2-oxohepta-3-ene-1,7-dioic acid hydratase in catechol pathway